MPPNLVWYSPSVLEIWHSTVYRYARPVTFWVHRVMFRPRVVHDIHVLQPSLHVEPEAPVDWVQDIFSNSVAVVHPSAPADVLRLDCQCRVDLYGVRNLDLPLTEVAYLYPFAYGGTDLIRVAYSRTPEQAAPVSGTWSRDVADFVELSVDVQVSRVPAAEVDQSTRILRLTVSA